MRYEELGIQTLRQPPANARGAADALLRRAGYTTPHGAPTPLGKLALQRMEHSALACQELIVKLKLQAFATPGENLVARSADGAFEMLRCPSCGYGADLELARHRVPDTPSEQTLPLQRVRTPNCNTIEELSAFLQVPTRRTAKAMMYVRSSDERFVFAVVRGDTRLSTRKLEQAVGPLESASPKQIQEAGASPGYASPIGLRGAVIVVDELILTSPNLVCGANEPGFHLLNSNYGRDYSADIVGDITLAAPGDACPVCGEPMVNERGRVLADKNGCRYQEILSAVAEQHHDSRGLCLPVACAPFDVHLIRLPSKSMDTTELADAIYERLGSSGVSILYDDRDVRAGVKFYDADLIGLPARLTAGERGLQSGMLEFKARKSLDNTMVPVGDVVGTIRSMTDLS